MNLLQQIGPKCDLFGTCLLEDEHGVKMGTIRADTHSVEGKMRDIITTWLQGNK